MRKYLICLILAGCQAIPAPQTFNQKMAYGQGIVKTVALEADQMLLAGKINKATAANISAQDKNLEAALTIANQVYATNQTDGGNQLLAALTALNALNAYLLTLGK